MFTRMFHTSVLLGLAILLTGCGSKDTAQPTSSEGVPSAAPTAPDESSPSDSSQNKKSGQPNGQTKLDIASAVTPEGITHRFFKSFFGGDDATAFSLLTPKAQEATKDKFVAMASDTIVWEVQAVEKNPTTSAVTVKVQDRNEEGKMTSEELVFALRFCEGNWRVAGFFTNGFAVNYELKQGEVAAQAPVSEPVKVGQNPSDRNSHR